MLSTNGVCVCCFERSNGETATSLSDDDLGRLLTRGDANIQRSANEKLRKETGQEGIAGSCRVFHQMRLKLLSRE